MSKKTMYSFLLALLLGIAIKAWTMQHVGPCDAYLAGQWHAPSTVVVNPQGVAREVPCSDWFQRQPRGVQAACIVDGAVLVVFAVSVWSDWSGRRRYE